MKRKQKQKSRWFWASLIEMIIKKADLKRPAARVEVWDNLVMVNAANVREAVSKAWRLGKAAEGDSRGTLTLHGKPAVTKFMGVQEIGLMYDGVADGAEILWKLKRCNQKVARSLAPPRTVILREAQKMYIPKRSPP
jgi:hypothetical protein